MKKLWIFPVLAAMLLSLAACGMSTSPSSGSKPADAVELESIAVYPQSLTLKEGDASATELVFTPSDADAKDVLWVSSNTAVATVDNKGNITAAGKGLCTITAASTEYSNISCDISVTVEAADSTPAPSQPAAQTAPAQTSAPAKTSAADVYPNYTLTQSEVNAMSADQLRSAINNIYAKNGYIFSTASIQNYYSGMSWYTPVTNDVSRLNLSSMDKANLNLLVSVRDGKSSGSSGSSSSGSTAASSGSSATLWTYSFVQQNLTESMVSGYSSSDIQLMINTIYAMNGYIFSTQSLQNLFSGQSWYHGTTSNMGSLSFSSRDAANLALLGKYRG